ncbi:MAG: hypothetical protein RLZZ393_367 [Pseudomonadota bacterium]|jgi:type III pantothenate kinase
MKKRLLIDIGNSRLKWCIATDDRLGPQRALVLGTGAFPDLSALLRAARRAQSVQVASVAGTATERRLSKALHQAGLPAPRFIRSSPQAAGVRNGYREAGRLGVDRWVAAIGAWHESGRRATCVIDIGTATTVDVVDATGCHKGGLIVPGPALMVESLLKGTEGIARGARGRRSRQTTGPARDTFNAIRHGALMATAALVERAARDLRREHGRSATVYVTGGGADAILPLLEARVRHCPDLVLRGLALMDN